MLIKILTLLNLFGKETAFVLTCNLLNKNNNQLYPNEDLFSIVPIAGYNTEMVFNSLNVNVQYKRRIIQVRESNENE